MCDPQLAQCQEMVTDWLRDSIRRGNVSALQDGDFPRYAWHREGDTVYEARLVNRELGEYKGYPLNRNEWPKGMDQSHE